MRRVVHAVVAIALAGCGNTTDDGALATGGDDGGGSGGDSAEECTTDNECVLAAARCCDCPTFAMPADPNDDICGGVTCPMPGPTCPTNIHAACVESKCALACDVEECDLQCADGFALDAAGCVTCACLQVTERSCMTNSDCSEVAGDCCGCANGGTDTAVPTGDVASFEAGLDCPTDPSCPGVNTCQIDVSPQCVQGACALDPALPANACGRPDLPLCGTGMICAIDSDPDASAQGVGVCVPGS